MTGHTPFQVGTPAVDLLEMLNELKREICTRERVFPGWVSSGKLKKETADHRIQALKAIYNVVHTRATLWNVGEEMKQPSLFDTEPDKPQAHDHETGIAKGNRQKNG
jgi:hypothetical protein